MTLKIQTKNVCWTQLLAPFTNIWWQNLWQQRQPLNVSCIHTEASPTCLLVFLFHCYALKLLALLCLQESFFYSLQRFSMGFRSGLVAGQFKTVHLVLFSHSLVLLDVFLGHHPAERPQT